MADVEQKSKIEPLQRFNFYQLRQMFQNMGMKVIKGAFQSLNFISNVAGWKISNDTVEFNVGTFKLGGTLVTLSDITQLQTTIDLVGSLGGGVVALVPNNYSLSSSITIPSGVILDGNGSTIDFGNGAFQISAVGTNAYSTGTLAVNYGSTSVTGTGTTWTSAMIGRSILINDFWYVISARSSNTAITLATPFLGTSVSGVTYVIATIIQSIGIKNIILQNSSIALFRPRYCDTVIMDSMLTYNGLIGVDLDDCANWSWSNSSSDTCGTGLTFDNAPYGIINSCLVISSTTGGITCTKVTNTSFSSLSIQGITGVGLKMTNCSDWGMSGFAIIETSSHGIEMVSGNSECAFINGQVDTAGGDGIKLTATSDRNTISAVPCFNCTGYGINIANANCNKNIIVSVNTRNNTAGAINDSGTGTLKSAAVNDFS